MAGKHGYPRPQLYRKGWVSLNGTWDFALDPDGIWTRPEQVGWDRRIEVPYAPETAASGVAETGFFRRVWYRRSFDAPPAKQPGDRLILHFGAVDYAATVWVNGHLVVRHEGGYTPFSVDVTEELVADGPQTVVVRADDDPADLTQPRGKQDWKLEPHGIWYPRTTGIWQTVWLERLPRTSIERVRWTPNLERWEIGFESWLAGEPREGMRMSIKLRLGDQLLSDDSYTVVAGEVHRRVALSDPGIDDSRNELLWSPATPTLIHARLQLWADRGELVDEVESYTALRSIAIQGDRLLLNGRPYHLKLVLDQGYWPETGLTAPDDEALRHDVELAKAMGFNGVRKHQKVEDPRFLYWADRLGLLVWGEMPSAYRYTRRTIERLSREWMEALRRDISHPCIVAWVPFNESWGVPNLPDSPAERHFVQGLYHLTKTIDPTRPVIGNDGWEAVATDVIGIHDYDDDPERIARRYHSEDLLPRLFARERPGGRLLVLEAQARSEVPILLTEFGGIACTPAADEERTWGYSRAVDPDELAERYTRLLEQVRRLSVFAGFCYTQFTDTYQEANGLLYFDRTPKFPLEEIALATKGVVERPSGGLLGSRHELPMMFEDE